MTISQIKNTRAELFSRGLRLRLAVAALLIVGVMFAVSPLSAAVWAIFDRWVADTEQMYALSAALDAALVLLLASPLMYGLNTLAWQSTVSDTADISCLLAPYRILPRTWLVLLIRLVPPVLAGGSVLGGAAAWSYIGDLPLMTHNMAARAAVCAMLIAACAALVLTALIIGIRTFLLPSYAFRGDIGLGEAISLSCAASEGQMWRIIGFALRYTGWLALGIISLGVLLIYSFIPRFTTEYNIFADELLKGYKK